MLKDFLIGQSTDAVYLFSIAAIVVLAIFAFAFATIAFLIFDNLKTFTRVEKILLSIVAVILTALSILFFTETGSKVSDLVEMNSLFDRKIEEVYDVTKTGNQLIFNQRSNNSTFVSDLSSTITNETDKQYTFVIRNHVHQIDKSVVTEK